MYSTQLRELKTVYDKQLVDPRLNILRNKNGIKFVPGMGPLNPRIMLIGEQPGRVENEVGKPFQGESGRLLDRILVSVRLDKRDIFFSNVLKYWPRESNDSNKTRKADMEEFGTSAKYLADEIFAVNPDLIGLCGRSALQAVFPDKYEVFKNHGQLLDGAYVPLYHPAVLKYDAGKTELVRSGFLKLKGYLSNVA